MSKLIPEVRRALRARRYSRRTEEAYTRWIRRFVHFSGLRRPEEMGPSEVSAFLTHLAVHDSVAASTQNQALSALLFLYREVLGCRVERFDGVVRAKCSQRLPVVLSRAEVGLVLGRLEGVPQLVASLLYGTGVRLLECLALWVKDVDFGRTSVLVRFGKGDRDRTTVLPAAVQSSLQRHLEVVERQYRADVRDPGWAVAVPSALDRKYPRCGREWRWQWVFPATRLYVDGRSGLRRAGIIFT